MRLYNGIYKVRTITDEEDIIPVPAIGKLVYNIEEEESTIRKEDVNGTELDYEEYDERGDYDSLNSLDDGRVPTVINSLALATKGNFENWLQNLKMSEFEYLITPSNSYPYKRCIIRKIIASGKSIYKFAELEYKDVQTEVCLVPGYQEIKRKREALGEDFWYYAETFLSVLESGDWNSNLPSISSLFKELSKIKLSEQKKRINKLARDIMASLKVNNELVRDLIEEFNKIKMDNNLTLQRISQLS
ncbi:hypothetical protein [Paenibacillus sp. FSL L8-0158]|uniref:hypothetical protein n=1 Tax=Paenibacillus sp. FSL L8-0158 TaxID=2954752 RepID=UPI003158D4C4